MIRWAQRTAKDGSARLAQRIQRITGKGGSTEPAFLGEDGGLKVPGSGRIAERSSHFLSRNEPWAVRCVETIEIKSERSVRWHTTTDIVLPGGSHGFAWTELDFLFYVPIAVLRRQPPYPLIDLRDESGKALPVLNKAQNARITSRALMMAAEEVLGQPISIGLRSNLRQLCATDGLQGSTALATALLRLDGLEVPRPRRESPRRREFEELIQELASNSVLWTPVVGRPGERRIFKLAYDVEITRPIFRRQQADLFAGEVVVTSRSGAFDDVPYSIVRVVAGRRSRLKLGGKVGLLGARRLVERALANFALIEHEIVLGSLMRHATTHHLQILASDGLETRSLRALPSAVRLPEPEVSSSVAHSYLKQDEVARIESVKVGLRVGRRGFLTFALAACVLITVLLWGFSRHVSGAESDKEVAAPVLLLAPVILAGFAVRPGEHPIVSRLLGGVRAAVMLCAAAGVAAATGLAGARYGAKSLAAEWHALAITTTIATSAVLAGWLSALKLAELVRRALATRWRNLTHYARDSFLICGLCASGSAVIPWVSKSAFDHALSGSILVTMALGCLWLALFSRDCHEQMAEVVFGVMMGDLIFLGAGACLAYGVAPFGLTFAGGRGVISAGAVGCALIVPVLTPLSAMKEHALR